MLLKICMKVNISLLQIDVQAGDPEVNFQKVIMLIENLNINHNHYVLLPELWISGYDYLKLTDCFNFFNSNLSTLRNIAKDRSINIIGSVPWIIDSKIFNRSIFIDNLGNIAGTYDKIHLFKPLKEDSFFTPGKTISLIDKVPKIGLMICYDLRFPELSRKLSLEGAEIIFISAEWPAERIEHWKILNSARAIENQVFIAACNRVGESFDIKFGGHSLLISPAGHIIAELEDKEGVLNCEIDLEDIAKLKNFIDIKRDVKVL